MAMTRQKLQLEYTRYQKNQEGGTYVSITEKGDYVSTKLLQDLITKN